MKHTEKIQYIRNAIIKSHKNDINEILSDIKNDTALGPDIDSFDPHLLATYLGDKLNNMIVISWCDSINDIVNNYNKLFDLFSPK